MRPVIRTCTPAGRRTRGARSRDLTHACVLLLAWAACAPAATARSAGEREEALAAFARLASGQRAPGVTVRYLSRSAGCAEVAIAGGERGAEVQCRRTSDAPAASCPAPEATTTRALARMRDLRLFADAPVETGPATAPFVFELSDGRTTLRRRFDTLPAWLEPLAASFGELARACGAAADRAAAPASIGTATMRADGTLVLDLVATGPGPARGEAQLVYPPHHKDYRSVLEHLGGLRPGESKPVPPWPDPPPR
jgi:hypothetical protein